MSLEDALKDADAADAAGELVYQEIAGKHGHVKVEQTKKIWPSVCKI